MVLALMSVLGSAVMLSTRAIDRRKLYNASLNLQADLKLAQRMAIMDGKRYIVRISTSQNLYYISETFPDGPPEVIKTVRMADGVLLFDITSPNPDGPNPGEIIYHPRGTASHGFTVFLRCGRYSQRLTGAVSGGRINIEDMITLIAG